MSTELTAKQRSERYVRQFQEGTADCPVCQEGELVLQYDDLAVVKSRGSVRVGCSACGASWAEQWALTGITDIKEGE